MSTKAMDARTFLRSADYDCIFHDSFAIRLRTRLAIHQRLRDDALTKLEQEFEQKPDKLNLLTFLHMCSNRNDEAIEVNRDALNRYPDNLAALAGSARLLLGSGCEAAANAAVETIATLTQRSPIHVLLCKGEVASALGLIGSGFSSEAINRYKALAVEYRKLGEDDTLKLKDPMCDWSLHLAQISNSMLSQKSRQKSGSQDLNSKNVYEDIVDSVNYVLENGDAKFRGQAYVVLAQAFRKRRLWYDRTTDEPVQGSADELIGLALKESPDDPYVVEQCGQYYRHRAVEKNEDAETEETKNALMEEAIITLKKYNGPPSVVVFRQLGLIRRWLNRNGKPNTYKLPTQIYCLEMAVKLTNGKVCKHLVELANTFLYLKEYDKADEQFTRASHLMETADYVDDDGAWFMYHRWAAERDQSQSQRNIEHDILPIYREAVRLSMGCPSDAYIKKMWENYVVNLRKVRSDEVAFEHEIANDIRETYEKETISVVDVLKSNPTIVDKAHRAVTELCNGANTTRPKPTAAFFYLTALIKSGRLNVNKLDDRQLAVAVVQKVFDEKHIPAFSKPGELMNYPARYVFRWLAGERTIGKMGFSLQHSEAAEVENVKDIYDGDIDVCYIEIPKPDNNDDKKHPGSSTIDLERLLRKHFGLHVLNVDASSTPLHEIIEVVAQSKALLIVDDGRPAANFKQLNSAIFSQLPPTAVVVIVETPAVLQTESPALKSIYPSQWPRLKIIPDPVDMARSLLTAIANSSLYGDVLAEQRMPSIASCSLSA